VKLCVLELLWLNFSATKSQRHKKPQNIKHLKSNVNPNFKQSFNTNKNWLVYPNIFLFTCIFYLITISFNISQDSVPNQNNKHFLFTYRFS